MPGHQLPSKNIQEEEDEEYDNEEGQESNQGRDTPDLAKIQSSKKGSIASVKLS